MNSRKGFSLIEVVVSMSIFVLVMISFSVMFAGVLKTYQKGRNINENVENAQFAMSLLGKTIRTSTLKSPTGTNTGKTIIVYDYSQGLTNSGLCIKYTFQANSLTREEADVDEAGCRVGTVFGSSVNMTSGEVDGNFFTTSSDGNTAGESLAVGRVTISMEIATGVGNAKTEDTILQTTVSLRDYGVSNIGIDINP